MIEQSLQYLQGLLLGNSRKNMTKMESCQVGVFLGYTSWNRRTLIDKRLYLPDDWANDPVRRRQCGVPEITLKTKAELGLEMLLNAREGGVPFAWVGMGCFYGQQPWFLDHLNQESFLYIADIPSDTRVWLEEPEVEIPERKGKRGRHPTRKQLTEGEPEPVEVRKIAEELSDDAGEHTFLRDTERKELWSDMARNASSNTKMSRLAEMSCSRYWIERGLKTRKGR